MLPKYFFNGSRSKATDAIDYYRQGVPIFCSICKSRLSIAMSSEEAFEKNMPKLGIYCPNGHIELEYANLPLEYSNLKKSIV